MQVHKLLNIHEIREQYNIPTARFYNYQVGYDNKIYFIMSDNNHKCHYFRITYDWEAGKVMDIEKFNFENYPYMSQFWCPYFDYYLLACVCADYQTKEPNAYVVDKNGNIIQGIYIGHAIAECTTTPNGRIITGYLDEGIDNEWNRVAEGGLTIWNDEGRWIWKNKKYDIWYCYAMTLDPCNRLWFYYYGSYNNNYDRKFHLVFSKKGGDVVFSPDIKGSDGFAVSRDYKKLLIGDGYDDRASVYRYDIDMGHKQLLNLQKEVFILADKEIEFYRYMFSRDKVFLHMEDGTIATGEL